MKTFLVSLVGTALAELCAVPFYYPYDLVKVRIQTMQAHYGYTNFIDGCFKIWAEKPKIQDKFEKKPTTKVFMNLYQLSKI